MILRCCLGVTNRMLKLINVSCHTSKSTKVWFKKENNNNNILLWPSQSLDLNFWDTLSSQVYANNEQFISANESDVTNVKIMAKYF